MPFDMNMMGFAGFAALSGLFGILVGMWSKIKSFAYQIKSRVIRKVEIVTNGQNTALISYLIKNYKKSSNYDKVYGAAREDIRSLGRQNLVAYELFGSRTTIFWNGWLPFVYSDSLEAAKEGKGKDDGYYEDDGTKTKDGKRVVFASISYIRGTLDIDKLLLAATEAYNKTLNDTLSIQEVAAKDATKRFKVINVPDVDNGANPKSRNSYGDDDPLEEGLGWYMMDKYRILTHDKTDIGPKMLGNGKKAMDMLFFPNHVMELVEEVKHWHGSKDWYDSKGITWKRGWLLYGPPGSGKSAIVRAFAEDLNMPIYVYNLADMGNNQLIKEWKNMQANTPCIALIEDIDGVFHGRENVAAKAMSGIGMFGGLGAMRRKKDDDDDDDDDAKGEKKGMGIGYGGVTFDCLLNVIDGVARVGGVFTIITTNDVHKVDPALGGPNVGQDMGEGYVSNRPGRVDKVIELTYMTADDKKKMAAHILGEYRDEYDALCAAVDAHDVKQTPAQFQELCAQIALKRFWSEKKK